MMKITDRIADAECAKLAAKRDKVVIMNPDEIIGLQKGTNAPCKGSVHVAIDGIHIRPRLDMLAKAMHHRPEMLVGHAFVVILIFPFAERHGQKSDVAAGHLRDLPAFAVKLSNGAVPTEPYAAAVAFECGLHTDGKAAGIYLSGFGVGKGYAI